MADPKKEPGREIVLRFPIDPSGEEFGLEVLELNKRLVHFGQDDWPLLRAVYMRMKQFVWDGLLHETARRMNEDFAARRLTDRDARPAVFLVRLESYSLSVLRERRDSLETARRSGKMTLELAAIDAFISTATRAPNSPSPLGSGVGRPTPLEPAIVSATSPPTENPTTTPLQNMRQPLQRRAGVMEWGRLADGEAVRLIGIANSGETFNVVIGNSVEAVGRRLAVAARWLIAALQARPDRRGWKDLVLSAKGTRMMSEGDDASADSIVKKALRPHPALLGIVRSTRRGGIEIVGEPRQDALLDG